MLCVHSYYALIQITQNIINLIFSIFGFPDCGCLEMMGMSGQEEAKSGDIVTFKCKYDLGRDAVYSIKWFKDEQELYRFIPTDNPEYRIFSNIPGVTVMVRIMHANVGDIIFVYQYYVINEQMHCYTALG